MTSRCRRALPLCALLALVCGPAFAQQPSPPVPPPPPPAEPTVPADEPPAPAVSEPSGDADVTPGADLPPKPSDDRVLPRLDIYFPEGDLDLRVSRLINKTFFEGQVKYNFVRGDITAFLRYRYYGYRRTTQFTVFDSIEFDDIDQDVSQDFDRVRGTLFLFQWPHNYNHRTFLLTELDRISTNKGERGNDFFVRRDRTNTFVRLGYQLGTPDEGRSSAIAGETRARTERLFSAFREFGPGDATVTTALTYGFPYGPGDFDSVTFELEALKPDLPHRPAARRHLPQGGQGRGADPAARPGRDRPLRRPPGRRLPPRRARIPEGIRQPHARDRATSDHLGVFLSLVSREPPQFRASGLAKLVLDSVYGNRDPRLRPRGLQGLRFLYPRRRHRLRVIFQAPEISVLSLRDCGTGFERRWGIRSACLRQVVSLSVR
jgi:hypothetical protein